MNIKELYKQAVERINAMTGEEIRAKFIEHGYVPNVKDLDKDDKNDNQSNKL